MAKKGRRSSNGLASVASSEVCPTTCSAGWMLLKGLVLTLFGVLLLMDRMTLTKAFAWVFLFVGICMLMKCAKSSS